MLKILTIAGSDSSGGAGIQADIKTISAHRMYGMSAITALTAQNTMGVIAVQEIEPQFLASQLDAVFTDIFPDAVKIGMVSNSRNIGVIAGHLKYYNAKNIVVDPVMLSTGGSKLLTDDAKDLLVEKLFPLARIITPNIPESEALCGFLIKNKDDMIRAAKSIGSNIPGAVLIKGGHRIQDADDLLYDGENLYWFHGERINNPNTHGTGCTLSSAIACYLADGKSLEQSIELAKEYVSGAIAAMLDLGRGAGPLNHGYRYDGGKSCNKEK